MTTIPSPFPSSGSENTIYLQIQTSLENAITTAGSVYRNLGLLHRTSVLDAKHEFATLSATIVRASFFFFPAFESWVHSLTRRTEQDQAAIGLKEFPADKSDESQVMVRLRPPTFYVKVNP